MATVRVMMEFEIDDAGFRFAPDDQSLANRIEHVLRARFPWENEPGRIRAITWEMGDSPRPDPGIVRGILQVVMVGENLPSEQDIAGWSDLDRDRVVDWAAALHQVDHGAKGVIVPPKPACVQQYA